MKTKSLKLKTILTLSVAVVCMFCAFAFTSISPAKANTNVVFEMNTQAQARIADPSGIRFVAKMNEATKNAVQSQGSEFGFLIAPSVYFTDQVVSAGKYHDSFAVSGAEYKGLYDFVDVQYKTENSAGTNDFDKITASTKEDGVYLANGVLANIKEANLDLDFSAVAYYKTSGDTEYTYADLNISELKKNIHSIVSKEYLNAELPADTEMLVDAFNIGSDTANGDKPAMSVLLTDEADFSAMLDKQDTAWYQLANDITIAQAQEGTPDNTYDATLTGILDGNGHKIIHNVNYYDANNTKAYYGMLKEVSGTIKNVVFDTEIKVTQTADKSGGGQSIICENLTGTIKDCVIDNTYILPNLSMSNGVVGNLISGSKISNVLYIENGDQKSLLCARTIVAGATIEDFTYIGASYNATINGYGNGWIRAPFSGDKETYGTITNFTMYPSIISALTDGGQKFTGVSAENAGYYGNEDKGVYTSTSDLLTDLVKNPISMDALNVKVKDNVAYVVESINVATASDFINMILAKEQKIYNITADIEIGLNDFKSANLLNAEDKITTSNIFGSGSLFKGLLNGNKHTVKITTPAATVWTFALINELSGTITDTRFEIDMSATMRHAGNMSGVIADILTGKLENCVVEYKIDATLNYKSTQHKAGIFATLSGGTVKNCVFINENTDSTVWVAGIAPTINANSTIEDVVIITPQKRWSSVKEYFGVIRTVSADVIDTLTLANIYHYSGIANALNGDGRYLDVDYYKTNYASYAWSNSSDGCTVFYKELTSAQGNTKTPDNVVSGFTFTADGASFTK